MRIRGISDDGIEPVSPIYPVSKEPPRKDHSKQHSDQNKYNSKPKTKSINDTNFNQHIDIWA